MKSYTVFAWFALLCVVFVSGAAEKAKIPECEGTII